MLVDGKTARYLPFKEPYLNIMEEKVIKESEAQFFKSATKVLEGFLVMSTNRIVYYGKQARMKFDHGVLGNVVQKKMESAMGYGNPQEEFIFDIPLQEVSHGMKRFGFSKRLVISDSNGNEYKLIIKQATI